MLISINKINTNRNRNIIFNFVAQAINISFLFIYLPKLQASIGEYDYGKFVIFHTSFLILFQFNHIHTTFLKVLNSRSGEIFLKTLFLILIFFSTLFLTLFYFYNSLIFGLLFIVISSLVIFFLQSILVKKDINSISSYIIPLLNIYLILSLINVKDIDLNKFIIILSKGFLYLNLLTIPVIRFKYFKLKSIYSFRKWNYLYKRTFQTSAFSLVTILQTNTDKYITPIIFDLNLLGYYHLITLIPSRISSIYGNIALAFSKQIHEEKNSEFINFTNDFFKYSSLFSTAAVILICFFSEDILQYSFGENIKNEYYVVFYISVIISLIQSIGFYSFQIYSRLNKLYKMSLINLSSTIIFIISLVLLSNIIPSLYALISAVFISKISEFYNAYLINNYIRIPVIKIWSKYFMYIVLLTLLIYWFG